MPHGWCPGPTTTSTSRVVPTAPPAPAATAALAGPARATDAAPAAPAERAVGAWGATRDSTRTFASSFASSRGASTRSGVKSLLLGYLLTSALWSQGNLTLTLPARRQVSTRRDNPPGFNSKNALDLELMANKSLTGSIYRVMPNEDTQWHACAAGSMTTASFCSCSSSCRTSRRRHGGVRDRGRIRVAPL
jgi:hypothetical protein